MRPSHILIVDDEEDIRMTIQAALAAEGYETSTAATGSEALEIINRALPDVVLLDIMMPDIDGHQICRMIKENKATSRIAVVFASALREVGDKVAGLNIGADDYITKPYNMSELIAKIRAHCRIQKYQRRLERIVDFAHTMNAVELDDIAIAIIRKLDKILTADRYSVFIIEEDEGILRVLAHNHEESEMDGLSLPVDESPIMSTVMRTKEKILVRDYPYSEYASGRGRSKYKDGFALCVPLQAGGKTLGVLNLNGNSRGYFYHLDHNTLDLVAEMMSASLHNARAMVELRRLAITDGLTKLYNHRRFHHLLRMEFERSSRYGQPLSCVMLDIDFFKKINDAHGHPVGDVILKELAGRMKRHVRKVDTLARYGGEEFAMLLPQTDAASARTLAERIRSDTENTPFETDKGPLSVTISLGVCDTGSDEVSSGSDLVNKADEALYLAKREGRNRVVVFGGGER